MDRFILGVLLYAYLPSIFAAPVSEVSGVAVKNVGFQDVLQWGLALIFVLGIFGVFVWSLRKLSGLPVSGEAKMRVLGGLSLGMREKVVLLEVGNKQMVLGVTPGRIEALLVLDGEDRLLSDRAGQGGPSVFSQKLMQAMNRRGNG